MPLTRWQSTRVMVSLMLPWRRALGRRTVRRHVQGVDLFLPWSHALPDYARAIPGYGQNLVELAAALGKALPSSDDLTVIDIGANVGDSALQIIARTGARVLCVEGDPYWVDYLQRNVGDQPLASIEAVLLTDHPEAQADLSPIRGQGTTRFAAVADGTASMPTLSMVQLRANHPEFDQVRLIKSDTDGYDTMLIPAAASTWQDSGPVLFFEFDPILTKAAGDDEPNAVWQRLADLGYTRLAIWDNAGASLGQLDVAAAAQEAAILEPRPTEHGYHFWDVAARRADDAAAAAAFDALVPADYSRPAAAGR